MPVITKLRIAGRFRLGVELGGGENFVAQFPFGVARDDVANFDWRFARRMPQRGARKHQQLFLQATVPTTHFAFFPLPNRLGKGMGVIKSETQI